jgi:parvulin-like peptidyl-prolyl isomerase
MKGSHVALRPGQQDLTEDQAKAKAQDIYKRLKGGADFAKIAREESDDVGSGASGGDLGSVYHGRTVQPFEEAAFALKAGEISQPVKTQFGWHIIQVVERFDTPDKFAEQIRNALGPAKTEELITTLKKTHPTKVDESFFGPPPPPPATAPSNGK